MHRILASCFWRENSNVVEITKESLTFEKNVPLAGLHVGEPPFGSRDISHEITLDIGSSFFNLWGWGLESLECRAFLISVANFSELFFTNWHLDLMNECICKLLGGLGRHSVEKYNKTRSRFLGKNQHFFRQITVFTKEVTNELISRNFVRDRVL